MLLNNYYEYRRMMFAGGGTNYTHDPYWDKYNFVGTGGSKLSGLSAEWAGRGDLGYWLNKGRCQAITSANSTNESSFGVFFGTGSTPATLTDYTLANPITSGLTITNTTNLHGRVEDGNGGIELTGSFLLQNTTDAEMNIWEMGIITPVGSGQSSGRVQAYPALMERTVLSEPVTIQPGGAKLVIYRVKLNLVLNVD